MTDSLAAGQAGGVGADDALGEEEGVDVDAEGFAHASGFRPKRSGDGSLMDAVRLPRDHFDYSLITSRRPWTRPEGARIAVKGVWYTTGEDTYEWYKAER